jgi:Nuclease-related domain/AAA domain
VAQISPSFESINSLKDPVTPGERALLEHLHAHLSDDYEIYFQAYINGLRPDVVIIRRGWGVVIVEVKDWTLDSYLVDDTNNWKLRANQQKLMSPFQQVFGYKKSLFDLHIDGLAEARLMNRNFYKILKPFVYFHGSSKEDVHGIFAAAERMIKNGRDEINSKIEEGLIDYNKYEKKMNYLELKTKQINRDKGIAVSGFSLKKLHNALSRNHFFTDVIYDKFKRYLQPPYHVQEQGKVINYGIKQLSLTQSNEGLSKIKGVAGSGKTTVLAKRAVNAHKRHGQRVLILTFNLTLKNYIHDKISNVRESFSWGSFDIINFHSFIVDQRHSTGCPTNDAMDFESQFSDENMFDGYEDKVRKYHTILIDEIQDFERPWINIIRKYFLETDGEMVLFGDEGQNIYDRPIAKTNVEIGHGFGRWQQLTKSYRSKGVVSGTGLEVSNPGV